MRPKLAATLVMMAGVPAAVLGMAAPAAAAATRTVDFTAVGEGPSDRAAFAGSGVVFTSGDFVGFVQGDQALIGGCGQLDRPLSAQVDQAPFRTASVDIAAAYQGSATYTVEAYDRAGELVGSTSQRIEESGSNGYATLTVSTQRPARTLVVSCSDPTITEMEFGLAQVTLATGGDAG